MRAIAAVLVIASFPAFSRAAEKLSFEDRVEITRGLMAEYAKAKVLVPRSKKPLEINSDGTYDKREWSDIAKESGPAARTGDMIQITKIDIEADRLVLQLNHGFKGGRHWYDGMQVQGPMSGTSVPVSNNDSNAPGGTSLAILFHKPLEPIKSAELKKILSTVLDFDPHSVTEIYSETLPPATQEAIKAKRAVVGMNHEQVMMAMGRPEHKSRETNDGIETEDWVFGTPPGKITFITFKGDKVIKVKEEYAGLGTIAKDPQVVR
ncbi:MAG TPA: hypothetical protein VN736_09930 [Candidatus Limnocylindrales bacterium]|nr:hypothetical protein [Candidatus Limnocylindrales bacterium]